MMASLISTFSYFRVQLINLNYYNRNLWYMIIYDPTFLLTSCIWWITCGLLHPIYMNWNADEGEFFRCGIGKNRRPAKSFYQIWQSWNKRRSLVKYCVIYIIHYFFLCNINVSISGSLSINFLFFVDLFVELVCPKIYQLEQSGKWQVARQGPCLTWKWVGEPDYTCGKPKRQDLFVVLCWFVCCPKL